MKDYFEIENFLTETDYHIIARESSIVEPFVDPNGVFQGIISAKQQWFEESTELGQMIRHKINQIEQLSGDKIDGMQIADMIKPYDVHGDYVVQKNQKPFSNPTVNRPTYTIIIPLIDGEYHTVVFDQKANYNVFSKYKDTHNPLKVYVSNKDWQKYCGHCHSVDQKYLTIKTVLNWQKGKLLAFNRRYFHASANFTKPKRAVVIWLSKYN